MNCAALYLFILTSYNIFCFGWSDLNWQGHTISVDTDTGFTLIFHFQFTDTFSSHGEIREKGDKQR